MSANPLPPRAGVGLKAGHVGAILDDPYRVGFVEVHAENYMGAGGPAHRALTAVRERFPLSVHGVGLSIGAEAGLNAHHLERLAAVVGRYQPAQVSEHLAWSTHSDHYLNDLLPLPYTEATLARIVRHIDQVQERLSRPILIENPATYLAFEHSTMGETEFIAEMAERSGCGLLLDVNNVFVSAVNQDWNATKYINAFPLEKVEEIHLAGHAEDCDDDGDLLLIDAHDRPVSDAVWTLFETVIARTGPLPTLIEWDNDVPDWPVLRAEAIAAEAILERFDQRAALGKRHAAG
ncbi:DUF692 domain-containing protein [Pseudohoeflea sp. DP4N28-3]|uniref:UPF0276 protein KY465_03520 n=2 Tax=Pseudohoeflea coraliihabitans TaxID=2860393 RepID=A0ABS6WML0_9HYPH|nr:DUF692 domain-containing protein [Pseudohoeflea sp. DP4N28-3]MBW3096345.1 DUF692 domain-containing protein [Pseudohoeflea sp. DP4N28-3]